jgi:hypothetical protein
MTLGFILLDRSICLGGRQRNWPCLRQSDIVGLRISLTALVVIRVNRRIYRFDLAPDFLLIVVVPFGGNALSRLWQGGNDMVVLGFDVLPLQRQCITWDLSFCPHGHSGRRDRGLSK